jgi:predicted acyl esterase
LWLPQELPAPCLIEALPYRKDDITASYADHYERLVVEGGYAVCRVDLRGSGSSGGVASDEYPETEIPDLRDVIDWVLSNDWCAGTVGAFGTSYSGFNSLHLAASGIPELGAVCAFYSSDDRYTDDVHYTGGSLRAIDVVDYVTYMVAMNALPPVPAVWGAGWMEEWRRRIDATPPWVSGWLDNPLDNETWRRGSIRTGPAGEGYERITCPVMLVGGWADGYRNNTFRTVEHMPVPWRLLVGPWGHQDPGVARPGPNIDVVPEMIAWFDHHLRGTAATWEPVQIYVRRHQRPEPDADHAAGRWVDAPEWPTPGSRPARSQLGSGITVVPGETDVGIDGWISCAGSLPWGQPLDQRADNARSWLVDWPIDDDVAFAGNAAVHLRIRSDGPRGWISAKLCDVAPDGRSMLITRGYLDLSHRESWPVNCNAHADAPRPMQAGEWTDVTLELEATAHEGLADNRLRLALATADWPNIWPPGDNATIEVDLDHSWLELPAVALAEFGEPTFARGAGPQPADDGVVWEIRRDVLARRSEVRTGYGGTYRGRHGSVISDRYEGTAWVDTASVGVAGAEGRAAFEIGWPEAEVTSNCRVRVTSTPRQFDLEIDLQTTLDGRPFVARRFRSGHDRP